MQDFSDGPADGGSKRQSSMRLPSGLRLPRLDSADVVRAIARPPLSLQVTVLTILAGLLGVVWSQLVLTWTVGPVLPESEFRLPEQNIASGARVAETDFSVLVNSDPFFATVASQSSALATQVAAPETKLDLKLFGVRAGQNPEEGSAIVRTPDKQQGSFRVGDQVMAGVRLDQVLPDRIVISRAGVRESLLLDPGSESGSSLVRPAAGGSLASPSASRLSISDAFQRLQLRPRVIGNTISGFYITPESDPAVLRLSGLQQNDVVMSVNGVRLASAERITDVVDELQAATSVEVQVERDGILETMAFDLSGVQ